MTKNTPEKELEPFTASFLLQEFRKDMRHIDLQFTEFRKDIKDLDHKIDNRFLWTLSIQCGTFMAILGAFLGVILTR
jgi:hypothetical protein